jgi:4-aminobutyrate aminotransferase
MPLGAIVARERLMTWDVGAHGSTYGGNPVACAAALATLELIEDGLLDNARDVGELLLKGLRDIQARRPEIVDVRGRGLMIGIEFDRAETMHAVEQAAFRRGLLVLGAGDSVIRMSPPLVFRPDQAETALQVFDDAVGDVVGG